MPAVPMEPRIAAGLRYVLRVLLLFLVCFLAWSVSFFGCVHHLESYGSRQRFVIEKMFLFFEDFQEEKTVF